MQERPTKSLIGLSGIRGGLPIDIGDLVHARSVEDSRRVFKGTWDKFTAAAVVKTVCAFANDLLNLNGGYVVLGIETNKNGRPVLPPRGLDHADVDRIQREVRGQCNRIDPDYQPLLFPELYDDRLILVIWAPAGDTRPYQAPKSHTDSTRLHYVRHGSETVEATGALRSQLFEQAAKVPFDERRSAYVGAVRISERLVRELNADIGSDIGPRYSLRRRKRLRQHAACVASECPQIAQEHCPVVLHRRPGPDIPGSQNRGRAVRRW